VTPLPDVPQVLKVAVNGTSSERPWACIFHWGYTGGAPTVADCNTLAGLVLFAWNSNILPIQHEDLSVTSCVITDLTGPSYSSGESAETSAGSLVGGILPAGAAALVSYSINLRYRGGHPRQYLPVGDSTKLLNTSEWTTDFQTAVGDAITSFIDAVNGLSAGSTTMYPQCAVSYYSGNARRLVPVVLDVFYSGVSQTLASQRRRTRRRA